MAWRASDGASRRSVRYTSPVSRSATRIVPGARRRVNSGLVAMTVEIGYHSRTARPRVASQPSRATTQRWSQSSCHDPGALRYELAHTEHLPMVLYPRRASRTAGPRPVPDAPRRHTGTGDRCGTGKGSGYATRWRDARRLIRRPAPPCYTLARAHVGPPDGAQRRRDKQSGRLT